MPDVATGGRRCTYTFGHSRTIETFVVPATTGPVEITAVGAPGFGDDAPRSHGARVTGSFSFLSGTPLFITVGGDGFYDGYNGGTDGGGGASDVRLGLPDLQHRILVAGGGGGAGEQLIFDQPQGIWRFIVVPGGDAGQPGFASGGRAGTASAGGAGGGNASARGEPGTLGRGGNGAEAGGGGGGGGVYGGGGGGGCAGGDGVNSFCLESQPGSGGGGSSLVPPGGTLGGSSVLDPSVTITLTQYG
ncbi:MAG TPA: glycine-rich protein [Acidimicrobiia bacterium]|nr:glycine-rich protein [Acidimicrobiia bacterium]